jgi:hypothetical protein
VRHDFADLENLRLVGEALCVGYDRPAMQPTSPYPPRCLPLLAFAAGGPDVPLPFTRCRPAACTIRGTPMTRLGAYLASSIVLLTIFVSAWAAQGDIVSVDNWAEYPVGALLLSVPGPRKVYSSMGGGPLHFVASARRRG